MSDASSDVSPIEPMTIEQHHMRLDSGVSTASSSDYDDGVFISSRYRFRVHPPRAYRYRLPFLRPPTDPFLQLGRLS